MISISLICHPGCRASPRFRKSAIPDTSEKAITDGIRLVVGDRGVIDGKPSPGGEQRSSRSMSSRDAATGRVIASEVHTLVRVRPRMISWTITPG